MAIALRSTSSAGTTTPLGSTLAINAPAGVTAGDVLYASITGINASDFTAPSGWQTLVLVNNADPINPCGIAIFYHTAGAGEPASYTFTSASTSMTGGNIVDYSGVENSLPYDELQTTFSTIDASNPTTASVTPTYAGEVALAFFALSNSSTTVPTTLTGYTNLYNNGHNEGTYDVNRDGFAQVLTTTATVAPQSLSGGASYGWCCVIITIQPVYVMPLPVFYGALITKASGAGSIITESTNPNTIVTETSRT